MEVHQVREWNGCESQIDLLSQGLCMNAKPKTQTDTLRAIYQKLQKIKRRIETIEMKLDYILE